MRTYRIFEIEKGNEHIHTFLDDLILFVRVLKLMYPSYRLRLQSNADKLVIYSSTGINGTAVKEKVALIFNLILMNKYRIYSKNIVRRSNEGECINFYLSIIGLDTGTLDNVIEEILYLLNDPIGKLDLKCNKHILYKYGRLLIMNSLRLHLESTLFGDDRYCRSSQNGKISLM